MDNQINDLPSDDLKLLLIRTYLAYGYSENEAVMSIKNELSRRGHTESEIGGLEVVARMYANITNYGPKDHIYFNMN